MYEKFVTNDEKATQWRNIHNRMQAGYERSLRTDDTQLRKPRRGEIILMY